MSRLSSLASFFFLVALQFDSRRAEAEMPPVAVEVLPGASEIDPTALRDAVTRELGTRVVSGAAIALVVSIDRDRGELVVERREATGGLSRRVPLPPDHEQLLREAVFLIGNLARDEADDLVHQLRPQADAPAPKSTDDSSERKADAKPLLAPPRLESPAAYGF